MKKKKNFQIFGDPPEPRDEKIFFENNQKMDLFWILINFDQFWSIFEENTLFFTFFGWFDLKKYPKCCILIIFHYFWWKWTQIVAKIEKNHDFDSEKCSESSKKKFLKKIFFRFFWGQKIFLRFFLTQKNRNFFFFQKFFFGRFWALFGVKIVIFSIFATKNGSK